MTDEEDLLVRFKIVCRKCGSENTVLDIEQGQDYGGETGYSPGHITIGCNHCKANDFYMSI